MKLKDYLKQFEGLDPELELYRHCPDKNGCASGEVYKKDFMIGADFTIAYVNDNEFITLFVLYKGDSEWNKEILILE